MRLLPTLLKRLRIRHEQTEAGTRVVAYMDPNPTKAFGEVSIASTGFIYNFRVIPAFRGNGIASLLMRYSINAAPRPPMSALYLTARADEGGLSQEELEGFYRRHGFFATGVVTDSGAIEMRLLPPGAERQRDETTAKSQYPMRLEANKVGLKSKIAANEATCKALKTSKEYYERLIKENKSADGLKVKLARVKQQIMYADKEAKELRAAMERLDRAIKRAAGK